MSDEILHYFYDESCTVEAKTIEFEGNSFPLLYCEVPIGDDVVRQTFWLRFEPFKQNHIFRPDGTINVIGSAKLIETNMPRQLRPNDKFSVTIEWLPPKTKPTVRTLDYITAQFQIPGQLIAVFMDSETRLE